MPAYTRKCFLPILFFLLASLLTSCTYNPFSSDNHLTGNPVGAVAGAGVGGGAAWLLGANKPIIALSAIGGGALGYYLTTQTSAAGGIREVNGTVFTQGEYVTINLPSDQLFDSNSADFLPSAKPALESTAAVLAYYPNDSILISGNTSGFGTSRREQQLSERRAREVAAFLWAHGINSLGENGMTTRKLTYVGYDDYFPVANQIRAVGIRENSHIQITGYPSSLGRKMRPGEQEFGNVGSPAEPAVAAKLPDNTYASAADVLPPEDDTVKTEGFGEEPGDAGSKVVTVQQSVRTYKE